MDDRGFRTRQELMDAARVSRTLDRIAHEVLEHHADTSGLVVVGIRTRGVPLARRLAERLGRSAGAAPPVGALDITLYRDDLTLVAPHPVIKGTDIPCSIDGRRVLLVDDVLYTGRTVRAALDELVDFGRPSRIELAVLVDRGHRELPIRADYAGKTLTTTRDEIVQVRLQETDGDDRVLLMERVAASVPGRSATARPPARKRAAASDPRRRPAGGRRKR